MPIVKTTEQVLAEFATKAKFGDAVLKLARQYGLAGGKRGRPAGRRTIRSEQPSVPAPRRANGADRPERREREARAD